MVLNTITRQAPFYMPRVEEVLEGVGKAKFISKIELTKGYYQISMVTGDISKTAFICHRGKFEFLRMPFGVKNAPAVFQELMQRMFRQDLKYCTPYMDDIIFSDSSEEHLAHIETVLTKLRDAGLTANPDKCRWGGQQMEFLGHLVGKGKMMLPAHRAEALESYSKPVTSYSATKLEALALVATIEHFSYYLYGRSFQVFTDNKPLVQLTSSDRLNPRLKRMAFKLQHWLLEIIYPPGRKNTMADALSREECPRKKTSTTQQIPDVCLAPWHSLHKIQEKVWEWTIPLEAPRRETHKWSTEANC